MKKLLLAAAMVTAAALPAHALDVGAVISFSSPVIGCQVFGDAYEAFRIQTVRGYQAAEWFALQRTKDDDFIARRACGTFGTPRQIQQDWKWEIKRTHRTQYTAQIDIWACIASTTVFDVRPPSEAKPYDESCSVAAR
jgi:hypothetical protein